MIEILLQVIFSLILGAMIGRLPRYCRATAALSRIFKKKAMWVTKIIWLAFWQYIVKIFVFAALFGPVAFGTASLLTAILWWFLFGCLSVGFFIIAYAVVIAKGDTTIEGINKLDLERARISKLLRRVQKRK